MNTKNDITPLIRTIIADDHPLVLLAIENLMSTYPNMEIVGRATDSSQLFAEWGACRAISSSWICTCPVASMATGSR